jgi:hypothetical protein
MISLLLRQVFAHDALNCSTNTGHSSITHRLVSLAEKENYRRVLPTTSARPKAKVQVIVAFFSMGNAYCYVTNSTDHPIAVLAFNRADVVYRRYKALHILKPGKKRRVEALPHPEGIKIAVVYSVNARKVFWYKRWVVDNGIEISVDSVSGSDVRISGDVLVSRYTAGFIRADDFADFSEVVALLVPGPQPQDYIPSSSPPPSSPYYSSQHQQYGRAVEGHHASRRRSSHGSRKSFSHAEAEAEAVAYAGVKAGAEAEAEAAEEQYPHEEPRASYSRASYSSSSSFPSSSLPPPPTITASGAVVAFSRRRSSFSSPQQRGAEHAHDDTYAYSHAHRHSLDARMPLPRPPAEAPKAAPAPAPRGGDHCALCIVRQQIL